MPPPPLCVSLFVLCAFGFLCSSSPPEKAVLRVEFTGDELILALMSLIRATNPAMLQQGEDGFTVDFDSLDGKPTLTDDEQLLLKFRAALEGPAAPVYSPGQVNAGERELDEGSLAYSLELGVAEGRRLVETLERLESLQPWALDVLEMGRNLRARLATVK